jgi:serine/threonine protein kinase
MGTVWEARQESLGRTVALKVLSAAVAGDPVWVARFRAEAGQAARLSHVGILPVHAVGETPEGVPWYAMELVRGEDLAARLEREGPPDPETAARWVRDAARALEHAHAAGIVHRDVKPANLMLREDGRLVVADFGLAKDVAAGALTTTGLLVGTPYYMSPEAVTGERGSVGPPADVYGLGVTLYELLTGEPPFQADSALSLIRAIADQEPRPPSHLRASVPRDLETIVLAAMAKRPEDRYASAAALADDLDRYLASRTVSVRRPGPWERARRWLGRHRAVSAVAAAALLLLVGTVWAFTREISDRDAEHRSQIAQWLADAEDLIEQGRDDEAEEVLERAERVETTSPEDAERMERSRQNASLRRLLQRLKEIGRGEDGGVPARLAVRVEPADAVVTAMRVGSETRPSAHAAGTMAEMAPGVWRLHAKATGRVLTVATVVLEPGAEATLDLALPPERPETARSTFFAGVLHAAPGRALERLLHSYYLAWSPVPRPDAGRSRAATVAAERAAEEAALLGARLPEEAELRNAALVGALASDPSAASPFEGVLELGPPPEWATSASGHVLPWPRFPGASARRPPLATYRLARAGP